MDYIPFRENEIKEELLYCWNRLLKNINIDCNTSMLFEMLYDRYTEPHRYYHTTKHLLECLKKAELLPEKMHFSLDVEMAIWFHDAVYDPLGNDNEEKSAKLAKVELLSLGVSASFVASVCRLVKMTKHTCLPIFDDEKLLIDIDLSILAENSERFIEYTQQIRKEYSFVPEAVFNTKRAAVLRTFLDRPMIYNTPYFIELYEEKARGNLSQAIQLLS